MKDTPNDAAYGAAAWMLMSDIAAMKAVAEIEAGPTGAFLKTGEPVILFERHLFHRFTDGRFDQTDPDLSNPNPGGYGAHSEQHPKLQRAVALDREAALKACSWGLFQILGANHARAGYPELQRFVTAMYRSVDDHLRAFVMFIRSDSRLVDALRNHDWAAFAYRYNGPDYAKHQYDVRLVRAYTALTQEA